MSVFKTKTVRTSSTTSKKFIVARSLSPISFTIQLELNGGTCAVDHLDVQTGQKYSFPYVSKSGVIVEGWYKDAEYTDKITEDDYVEYHVQKIYVKWMNANVLTLTFLDGTKSYLTGSYSTLSWSDIGKSNYHDTTSIVSIADNGASVYSLGSSIFINETNLSYVSFPVCQTIGESAFCECYIESAIFPNCTLIDMAAFAYCQSLITVDFPVCQTIGYSAFYGVGIQTATFPMCTYIYDGAFADCYNLEDISFPSCQYIGSNAFGNCGYLTYATFPCCNYINEYAFAYCSYLGEINLEQCAYIGEYAFDNCIMLTALFLTGSSFCSLYSTNAFNSTPIGGFSDYAGSYGSIYVPASLYTTYINDSIWNAFSQRFTSV